MGALAFFFLPLGSSLHRFQATSLGDDNAFVFHSFLGLTICYNPQVNNDGRKNQRQCGIKPIGSGVINMSQFDIYPFYPVTESDL